MHPIWSESIILQQDIEVPETLLKKRKQNEKAREERLEKAASAKKVRVVFVRPTCDVFVHWNG